MIINVSLTTIYDNRELLKKCIMSLTNQTRKPDMIHVYLSKEPYLLDKGFTGVPPWLAVMPGVSVKFVENTGPYRKLLPILKEKWDTDELIITVDDDTVYAQDLIEHMVAAYTVSNGSCISCRTWFLADNSKLAMSGYKQNAVNNFHTGKGAVLYNPGMFKRVSSSANNVFSQDYLTLCKTNDDIWFNLWRMYNQVPCVIVKSESFMIQDCTNKPYALFNIYNERLNHTMYENTFAFIFGASS